MDTTNTETQAPVITLSEAAMKEVKRLINVQGITEGGLRLGVKGGGCSGPELYDQLRREDRPIRSSL